MPLSDQKKLTNHLRWISFLQAVSLVVGCTPRAPTWGFTVMGKFLLKAPVLSGYLWVISPPIILREHQLNTLGTLLRVYPIVLWFLAAKKFTIVSLSSTNQLNIQLNHWFPDRNGHKFASGATNLLWIVICYHTWYLNELNDSLHHSLLLQLGKKKSVTSNFFLKTFGICLKLLPPNVEKQSQGEHFPMLPEDLCFPQKMI